MEERLGGEAQRTLAYAQRIGSFSSESERVCLLNCASLLYQCLRVAMQIPSSVVGLWGVWKVGPALFTCVNVCVCEAVALQRSNVLSEFYRLGMSGHSVTLVRREGPKLVPFGS